MSEALSGALQRVYAKNYDKLLERLACVEAALRQAAGGTLSDEGCRAAQSEAHKLAGVLGTFGLSGGTALARDLEQSLRAQLDAAELDRLVQVAADLRTALKPPG